MAATTSSVASSAASNHNADKFILLLGVDDRLFKTCFGKDAEWLTCNCRIESLAEDCSGAQLSSVLTNTGGRSQQGGLLQCVVIQEDVEHPHWNEIKKYYNNGGFVAYFGIFGEFEAPGRISQELGGGMDWTFSTCTKHEYVVTNRGQAILGSAITEQPYTKSNLLSVSEEDRLMLPQTYPLRKYVENCVGVDPDDENYSGEFEQQVQQAFESGKYERYCRDHEKQCPLALHKDVNHGGRFAYIGFVNGDHNIPQLVRALLSGVKTKRTLA